MHEAKNLGGDEVAEFTSALLQHAPSAFGYRSLTHLLETYATVISGD